jgi:alpha-tubulin suppressor-like RCC1 family protein
MSRTLSMVAGAGCTGSRLRRAAVAVVVAAVACVAAPQLALATGTNTVIDAGSYFTCAIKSDRTPVCWGANEDAQLMVPTNIGNVTSVTAGDNHACAIQTDGTAVCWGNDNYGKAEVRIDYGTVSAVSAGTNHTCVIKTDGTPVCWGNDDYGQLDMPSDIGTVSAISAASYSTCAIKTDGTPVCWGYNGWGQLNVPGDTVSAISTGPYDTCVIRADGTPGCWGDGQNGQLDVPSDIGVVSAISTGDYHSCAIKSDSSVACWGYNGYGETSPPGDLGPVRSIAAGAFHTCAVKTDGTPVCWGDNSSGQAEPPSDIGTVGPPTTPSVSVRPSISGTLQSGQTLTADHGTWSNAPTGYSYGWQRCSGSPTVCAAITGSDDADDHDSTYTLTSADPGTRLRVRVVATNSSGSTAALSLATGAIGSKPVATSRPTITGTTRRGQTLTADHGTWDNSPTGYSYTWQRCSGTPTVCTTITGADADDHDSTYTLTDDDQGNRLRVRVTATNVAGTGTSSYSLVTAAVTVGAKPVSTARPAITGTTRVGQTLTTDRGSWDNDPTSYTDTWQRCSGSPLVCTTITSDDATDHDLSYTLTDADLGSRIRTSITATNAFGSKTSANSPLTSAVRASLL